MVDRSRRFNFADRCDSDAERDLIRRYSLRTAKHVFNLRRKRGEVFGDNANLFGEPAWDILLNLYIAFGEGKRLIRTDAAKTVLMPQTTVLRTLRDLEERGLVRRTKSLDDKRVSFESLTDQGVMLMENCLSNMVEPRRRSR